MEERRVKVIINEQHGLFREQKDLLDERFRKEWEFVKIPAEGWSLEQQENFAYGLDGETLVFASPVPYLLMRTAFASGAWITSESKNHCPDDVRVGNVYVFHNDKRDKKELPGGKIIQVVSETGWKLL